MSILIGFAWLGTALFAYDTETIGRWGSLILANVWFACSMVQNRG